MAKNRFASLKEKKAFKDLGEKNKKSKASRSSMSMGETEGETMGETGETEEADAASFSAVFGLLDEIPENDKLPNISASLDQGLSADLIGQTEAMLQLTGKEAKKRDIKMIIHHANEISKTKDESPGEAMMTIDFSYASLLDYCDQYIGDRNPWSKIGKQRLAIVKAIRYQAEWERNLISKYAGSVMAQDTYGSFGQVLEGCRQAVYNGIMSKAENSFLGSDRQGKRGKTEKQSTLQDAAALAYHLSSTYGISMEDAILIADSRKDIDQMDKFLGGEGISKELIEKIISQLHKKKRKIDTTPDYNGAGTARVNAATAYAEDKMGVKITNLHVNQFAFQLFEDGNDEATLAKNAALLVNLNGGEKAKEAWEGVFEKYLSFDISKFDDRSPGNILDNYEELHRQTYLGFIYERHLTQGARAAGFEVSKDQQGDMKALYNFYQSLHGYLQGIYNIFASEDSLLADSEKMDRYEDTVMERTQGQEYENFFERASADQMALSDRDQLGTGNWQTFGSTFAMRYLDSFSSSRSAMDILRKDFGWKSDKAPKDTKIIFEELSKKKK